MALSPRVLAASVAVVLTLASSPAAATTSEPSPTSSSTESTSDPGTEPSSTLPEDATTTTTDPTTGQTGTEPTPTLTTAPVEPTDSTPSGDEESTTTTVVDGETTTSDPLANEPQGEEAPEGEETVPPPGGTYAGQSDYKPAEILWSSVRAAERELADANETHELRIVEVRRLRVVIKRLIDEQRELGDDAFAAAGEFRDAEEALLDRAVSAFMSEDATIAASIGSIRIDGDDTILDIQSRRRLLAAALDADDEAIADYLDLRSSLDSELVANVDAIRVVEEQLADAIDLVVQAREEVEQAQNELEAFAAGSEIYIDDVVFPVGDGYGLPLIDSWGFPRMLGTPDEHWHEGIDIFAPAGTPLVAAERGVITKVGSGRLGGLTVWIRGESGAKWYYAHLQSHATGIHTGMVVEAGDLVGYVGNTGNAVGTPPHLHMQIHPGGGDPVNPYPLLKVISDRDLAERAATD